MQYIPKLWILASEITLGKSQLCETDIQNIENTIYANKTT